MKQKVSEIQSACLKNKMEVMQWVGQSGKLFIIIQQDQCGNSGEDPLLWSYAEEGLIDLGLI